jgi:hypothetical protein
MIFLDFAVKIFSGLFFNQFALNSVVLQPSQFFLVMENFFRLFGKIFGYLATVTVLPKADKDYST